MSEHHPNGNGFNEAKAERWYENKVTFLIAILTPVVIIMSFIFDMRQNIALIQQSIQNINTNHEVHIQDIVQELKEQQGQITENQKAIVEMQKQILIIINQK